MAFGLGTSQVTDFMRDIGQEGNNRLGHYLETGNVDENRPTNPNNNIESHNLSPHHSAIATDTDADADADADAEGYLEFLNDIDSVFSDSSCESEASKDSEEIDLSDARGDYFDVRDWFRCKSRHSKIRFLKRQNVVKGRVYLLREHLLSSLAFANDNELKTKLINDIILMTRYCFVYQNNGK